MGLDIVEMVMAMEERFGIHIPDAALFKLHTAGDYHEFVMTELREGRAQPRRPSVKSSGSLIDVLLRRTPAENVAPERVPEAEFRHEDGTVDEAAVWVVVRALVAIYAGMDVEEIARETDLVRDLGMD